MKKKNMFVRFIADMKKHFGYALNSAKSELKASVAGSYLNWVWWILEPFCFMLIYAFVFGFVFNAREAYFPVFIFTGISLWTFFSSCVNSSVKLIKRNKAVLSKVYLPKYVLAISVILENGFKMVIKMGIILAMLLFYRPEITWWMLFLIPFFLLDMFLITFGVMCFMMHVGVYIEDMTNITTIVLRMLFYCTGIFYNVKDRIGNRFEALGSFLEYGNPMAYILSGVRKIIIYNTLPDLKWLLIWFVFGIVLSALGVRLIYKNENSYVKAI